MNRILQTTIDSPLGELLLVGDGRALHRLHMQDGRSRLSIDPRWERHDDAFANVVQQLAEYFDGRRRVFDLELEFGGASDAGAADTAGGHGAGASANPFELRVWRALLEIPYGETVSYGQIAATIGAPTAARAVGLANGRNPIAVIVPCHRVIGADGTLTGYGGGLERKRLLLDLEAGVLPLVV
jgi:methylated-DNA-[protein]-cysteine S-methyltransferase